MNKVLWTVSLSNGETLYEEKGNFRTIEGERSPWARLLDYIAEEDVHITSLSLYTSDGRRWNLPSAGKNPKFKEFHEGLKPVGARFFRKLGRDVKTVDGKPGEDDHFAVIEAWFENTIEMKAAGRRDAKKLITRAQLWVDDETTNSWIRVEHELKQA